MWSVDHSGFFGGFFFRIWHSMIWVQISNQVKLSYTVEIIHLFVYYYKYVIFYQIVKILHKVLGKRVENEGSVRKVPKKSS